MSTSPVGSKLAQAWHNHREGRNANAISEFQSLLKSSPNDVDVYYGLGLAQRADGQKEAAVESFKQAGKLAKDAYDKLIAEAEASGRRVDHLLETTEDDRLMMMQRLIGQRLSELGVTVSE